ncbi:hypothetical protein SH449x_001613 [Pirellulaceae bacterium SH449]
MSYVKTTADLLWRGWNAVGKPRGDLKIFLSRFGSLADAVKLPSYRMLPIFAS